MKYLVVTLQGAKALSLTTHTNSAGLKVRLVKLSEDSVIGAEAITTEDPEADGYSPIVPEVKPTPVPQEVPLWAFRTVAAGAGLLDDINTAIGLLDEPAKTAATNLWEYGNVVTRKSPTVLLLAPALGLSSEQVDDFFRQAGALVI